jgi:segregation and condensation protein B
MRETLGEKYRRRISGWPCRRWSPISRSRRPRGEIAGLAGGYQFITRPEYAVYIKKLQKIRPPKLSAQSLETLAIIAYRQPIIKAEIEAIRGVSADGVIKTLLDRRLVKIAGRQDVPGKPMMYATTNEFLQYFGLKDLNSLPSLRELRRESGMEENSILSGLEPELPGSTGRRWRDGRSTGPKRPRRRLKLRP